MIKFSKIVLFSVWDFEFWSFEIVSSFGFRASNLDHFIERILNDSDGSPLQQLRDEFSHYPF